MEVGDKVIGFSEEELAETQKVVGSEAWARQYMQRPMSKQGKTFSERMVQECLDGSRGITDHFDILSPGMMRIASLDPALSGHAAFMVAGIDAEKLYLVDSVDMLSPGRYEELWDKVEELSIKWQPTAWVIEGNAVQGGIARSDRIQEIAEKQGFIIHTHQTGRNKQDTDIGVASMAGTFRRHQISIPNGDDEAVQAFAPLLDQLDRWRPDVPTRLLIQDQVMALWFLHLEWQRRRPEFANRIDRRINVGGMPFAPTRYSYVKAGR